MVVLAWVFAAVSPGAVQPQAHPQRIISLIPAVTEMLFAIGAGPQVVGVGSYDNFPAEVQKLPRVGALLDPDIERIISLKPDLVVVYATQSDLQKQLERAKIPIFRYEHAGLADVTVTIRQLGDRIGRSAEATKVTQQIERALDDIRRRTANRPASAHAAGLRPRSAGAARDLRKRRSRIPAGHARSSPGATTCSRT